MKKLVIIGSGAAGIFAAIRAKKENPSFQVIVLEKTNKLLSKVLISGGGRCNVTHFCFDPKKLIKHYPRGSKELLGPFYTFGPKDTVYWFKEKGVTLKTEADGRMFPVSDSSETIINCLLKTASNLKVDIRKNQKIVSISKEKDQFSIILKDETIIADKILIATGSAKWGHNIAKEFGHTIVEPVPSLFTLNIPSSNLLDLSGISVPNVKLSLKNSKHTQEGPFLLTHWGFSGPASLKLSAWAARYLHSLDYKTTLLVNWTASTNQEVLYQCFLKQKKESPKKEIQSLLPKKLWIRLLSSINIDHKTPIEKHSNKTLLKLASKLYADSYELNGKSTYKNEFVVAGGIDLKELNFKTMESRITPGLFFAGEVINVDGITGGFNFQNAWTTAWLSGKAMTL